MPIVRGLRDGIIEPGEHDSGHGDRSSSAMRWASATASGSSRTPRSGSPGSRSSREPGRILLDLGFQSGDHRLQIAGSAAKSLRAKRFAAPGNLYTAKWRTPQSFFSDGLSVAGWGMASANSFVTRSGPSAAAP